MSNKIILKGSCCGNSFVVKNYDEGLSYTENLRQCADLICENDVDSALILRKQKKYSCELLIFERDKTASDFCGNGALFLGYFLNKRKIETKSGIYRTYIKNDFVYLETSIEKTTSKDGLFFVKGVEPHIVSIRKNTNVRLADVLELYHRYHEKFNITFLSEVSQNKYRVRTYERGVNDFTKSCGTSVIASMSILLKINPNLKKDILFISSGGEHFANYKKDNLIKIWTHKNNLVETG